VRYHNDGKPLYFMGSADWMTRNLMRRVEVATPVEDPALQAELDLCLNACLQDATL
jgi:polyphosphate kinase